eukprot:Em0013g386a
MVGYMDMTDPTQQCPDSWQKITSPRSSCGKKSSATCDSLNITTSGASYQTVCGRFRGYQIGSTDAFDNYKNIPLNIETYYVDGVTVTYGMAGNRHHVYTYAAGWSELNSSQSSCPCTGGGTPPPPLVGSDYYCESANPGPGYDYRKFYYSDVLWDRHQCGGNENMCCNPPDLPWFCKTFPTPISEDLEVRICTDEGLDTENVGIESFELYIHVQANSMASIDTSIIGLTIAIAFVVFFSLGVLVATCIGCVVVKKRSTVTLPHQPALLEPLVYEMIESDQKKITTIKVETNSAYGTAKDMYN